MTTCESFRRELRQRLQENRDRVLLRLFDSPHTGDFVEFTGAELLKRSEELARREVRGDEPGVVLLLLPHSAELFLLQLGLVLRGHYPAVIAWPTSRIDPEKYQRNLLHQLCNLPAAQLVTLPRLAGNLAPGLPYQVSGCGIRDAGYYEQVFPVAPVASRLGRSVQRKSVADTGEDALFLQFSGGTTGAQKAVVVTAEMLRAQLERLSNVLRFGSADHVVSWLPMYHDMGLIACLWLPLWAGARSTHLAANDWVINPELLIKYISAFHGTFCWLPNFAFSYLSQRRSGMAGPYDLAGVRGWINCSEPVRLRSMTAFAETFADWGVRPEALQASYAMAETVFAITETEPGRFPRTIPRSAMNGNGRSYPELAFNLIDEVYVSSGVVLPDTEVRITGPDGGMRPNGVSGEIQVRTPSLFGGYWGDQGFVRHTLSADGWHATGDYGFLAGEDLYVIGRIKDIVIVGGQNVFPEDVETVVNTLGAVYTGRVVAFGIQDDEYRTESLAVVAEMRGDYSPPAAAALEGEIRKLVLAAIGVAPRYVAAVPQRWIVKSTAGKISRRETRERFVAERLAGTPMEVSLR